MEFRWRSSGRQGSALLIVLGMFAFMLVSAVSFSIYMRSSRAPSSYVRRNASARHLVKAALARAIDEIDMAIGNDPFPGVGFNHDYGNDGLNQSDRLKNDNWHGRVFTPSNEVAHADTVSTLSLEALGYLPPCLIDEVRYWSRHTRTAKWHSFNYGLGQYAFTAVNVSDLFDLNQFIDLDGVAKQRLNRSSSEHGRISPTYLFRTLNTGDMDTGKSVASAFLSVMKDGSALGASPSLQEVPFVSMMDFNLAIGSNPLGGMASPFMARLNGSSGRFYDSVGEDVVRRQVFMAGGWNGSSNLTWNACANAGIINLGFPEAQPFWRIGSKLENAVDQEVRLVDCMNVDTSYFWRNDIIGFDKMPTLSAVLLSDYLDCNSIPISLCVPCTEAVPMLCGARFSSGQMDCSVEFEEKKESVKVGTNADGSDKMADYTKHTYKLKIDLPGFIMKLATVYPFKSDASKNYTAEVVARVFLSANSDLRVKQGTVGLGPDLKTWPNVKIGSSDLTMRQVAQMGQQVKCRAAGTQEEAVDGNLDVRLVDWDPIEAEAVLYYDEQNQLVDSMCVCDKNFTFYDADWNPVEFFATLKKGGLPGVKFTPSVSTWVRIVDGAKTVDMVPAIAGYDNLNWETADANGFYAATGSNAGEPMLRFFGDGAFSFELTKDGFQNRAASVRYDVDGAYVANDPRINWAPEHWMWDAGCNAPGDAWLERGRDFRNSHYWCDSDIFMSVSDQGYMQSMYEWLFIPQTRRIAPSGEDSLADWGEFQRSQAVYDGKQRTVMTDVAHANLMWRTYRSDVFFPPDDAGKGTLGANDGGNPNNWGSIDEIPFMEPENGLRVNPYTDSMNIMLGAFANMPCDWWAAGTNHTINGKSYMAPNSSTFEDSNLFDWSCKYQDVYNMAYYWMGAFKRWDMVANEERGKLFYRPDQWKQVFDDAVIWYDGRVEYDVPVVTSENTTLDTGILNEGTVEPILKNMTLADRKFLYGYLKGCFANTHQLFLVFVRAESAAGGGGAGSGARAVALVWRDPQAPMKNGQFVTADGGTEAPMYGKDNAQAYLNLQSDSNEESWHLNGRKYPPHRTRVLFYHQLD